MLYFICWVVFLVGVILSVVVAHVMSNRGNKANVAPAADDEMMLSEEMPDDEGAIEDPQAFEEVAEFGSDAVEQVDDFEAFEEEFK
ncbi:hypothetical protein [Rhodopirellula sallentina]|uniref:Uncharacterized protein n=1 Tax=Rhodopirellula sallentina SM41 TaxID=1263870 RepID=M5UB46_9BACT|nr:hypothetical protein [Rhodopirellula sallentina]EMI53198.1 hypothetical protein RSSM_05351 [Rhodopirellula sallentina SM41]